MQDHYADLLLGTSGLQSDVLVVEARARGSFFGASATKKWTIIDWKVNVSKPAPIHGEHQAPAQWPHTRIFPGKTKLVLQPRSSAQTYNQEPNNIQQTYTKPTFKRSPKPTNDKQLTNQNTGRCCHRAKSLENAAWQASGSGKMANTPIKEHLLSQGKLIGETSVVAGKILEAAKHTYEGIVAMNENQKEGNLLLKELVAGQKLAMERVAAGGGQAASPAACPPVTPASTIPAGGGAGYSTGIPAAFGGTGGTDPVPRIPGTNLPQPPLVPAVPAAAPATLGTTAMERDRDVAPGFKRMKLANGQYLTVPESWMPEDPSI